MSDLDVLRELVGGASAALERSRQRIDDLNVYPVPDGDTGTNLALTVRGIVDALDRSGARDCAELARETTRAALMSARGNSGVILSQIVRGAADTLGSADAVDAQAIARAFRAASDEAYRAVRRPVEGTMLTVIRELAEEAERVQADGPEALLAAVVARGEDAVERTREELDVLREAGVVDAGGAGLLELVRGISAVLSGEALPDAPAPAALPVEAVHQEPSRYRYCTLFVIEGDVVDRETLERELELLGDSLLVVGDATAVKVHVHTDDPGAAVSLGTKTGAIDGVEIADMHRQTGRREERLLQALPGSAACAVVAGGQTMNPPTADLLAAVEAIGPREVVLLPNNSNVVMAAEQAARLASKHVQVVPTRSIQAGLAAAVAFNPEQSAARNARAMREAADALVTAEIVVASRDATVDGVTVRRGEFLGRLEEAAVAAGPAFDDVARRVLERVLEEPRDVLTLLRGEDAAALDSLLDELADRHPDLELDVHEGGQTHQPLLISAE